MLWENVVHLYYLGFLKEKVLFSCNVSLVLIPIYKILIPLTDPRLNVLVAGVAFRSGEGEGLVSDPHFETTCGTLFKDENPVKTRQEVSAVINVSD